MKIDDLEKDLHDGILLINLLEQISNKKLPKYNKKPKIRAQKLENLAIALKFLKGELTTPLVGIGPEDINAGNLKLILGMIWTIILRYQIQVGGDGGSAKSELLKWVRSKIGPGTPFNHDLKNFTSDWQDGKAISDLAEALEPGLGRDFSGDALKDATKGMEYAEKKMGIPMVLDPADMIYNPDELANMTYISFFRDYLDAAKKKAERDRYEKTPVPGKCRAYGPGLEKGEAGIPAEFKIESINGDGRRVPIGGHPFKVDITTPSGGKLPAEIKDNNNGLYDVVYTPTEPGNHKVAVTLFDQHIAQSPFNVPIMPAEADASKCKAYGPGLEKGEIGKPGQFTIESVNKLGNRIKQGGTPFEVVVDGPYNTKIPCKVKDNNDGTYACEYLPVDKGPHTVNVNLKGKPVADSPYKLDVAYSSDPNVADPTQSYAKGPGLEPGVNTSEPAEFTIYSVNSAGKPVKVGGNPFDVQITGPKGDIVPAEVKDNNDGTYKVTYQPTEEGKHNVDVVLRNKDKPLFYDHIKNSPITVDVEPGTDASKCIAYGPGLEDGILDTLPQEFTIEARDKKGNPVKEGGHPFKVDIKGPNGPVPADITDNNDGTYKVKYQPKGAGPYNIDVKLDDKHIKDAPFKVRIDAGASPDTSCIESYSFVVRSKLADGSNKKKGGEDFACKITGAATVEPTLKDIGDGTYLVTYSLPKAGKYEISVTLNGKNIKGSPWTQTA